VKTIAAIESRRSVKHYDPDFVIPKENLDQLFSLALLSPTSFNIQNWRFVNVVDKDLRAEIRKAAWNQAQVTESSVLLILCGNLNAWNENPERYWINASAEIQNFLVPKLREFYQDREWIQRDEVMRSCGIAAQTLMLAARSMGYDSNPMIGFDQDEVGRLIRLPANHAIGLMLVIGKAIQPARSRGGQLPVEDVIIQDRFSTPD